MKEYLVIPRTSIPQRIIRPRLAVSLAQNQGREEGICFTRVNNLCQKSRQCSQSLKTVQDWKMVRRHIWEMFLRICIVWVSLLLDILIREGLYVDGI